MRKFEVVSKVFGSGLLTLDGENWDFEGWHSTSIKGTWRILSAECPADWHKEQAGMGMEDREDAVQFLTTSGVGILKIIAVWQRCHECFPVCAKYLHCKSLTISPDDFADTDTIEITCGVICWQGWRSSEQKDPVGAPSTLRTRSPTPPGPTDRGEWRTCAASRAFLDKAEGGQFGSVKNPKCGFGDVVGSLSVEIEEYQGKKKSKIQWLNAADGGGRKRMDEIDLEVEGDEDEASDAPDWQKE